MVESYQKSEQELIEIKTNHVSMIQEMRAMQISNNELIDKTNELEAMLETQRNKETKIVDQYKRRLKKVEQENSQLQKRMKESFDVVEQLDFEKAKLKHDLEFVDHLEADKQAMEAELDYRFE